MLLGGLWHGASWTFVIWGAFHGTGLAVERWFAMRDQHGTDGGGSSVGAKGGDKGGAPRSPGRWAERLGLGPVAPKEESPVPPSTLADHRGDDATLVMSTQLEPIEHRSMNPWLARLWVFHFVVVGWIFFRAPDLGTALSYLWGLLTNWGIGTLVTPVVLLAVAVGMVGQFVPRRIGDALEFRASHLPPAMIAVGVGLFFVVCNLLGPQGVAPFIYFAF